MVVPDAKVTNERGCKAWRCPNCDRKLAEIVGSRVIIRSGDIMISLGIHTNPDQTCPRCGTSSVLCEEQAA